MLFNGYSNDGFFDEMFDSQGAPRPGARALFERYNALPLEELKRRQEAAEKTLMQMGITFSVYGDDQGTERIFRITSYNVCYTKLLRYSHDFLRLSPGPRWSGCCNLLLVGCPWRVWKGLKPGDKMVRFQAS